jgi:pimeloyl-ACP methyl ester carboxylesterase
MPPTTLEFDGCRIAYRITGTGSPVLLIQGVGLHGDGWTPQVEGLSTRQTCLSFDNRGMGRSQPLVGRLTVERMAGDALALMDAAGWASAHVVGHSLGGLVAMHMGLTVPQRVRSLGLLCTLARGRDATRLTRRILGIGLRSSLGTRRMRRRGFLEIVLSPAEHASGDLDGWAARLEPLFGHDLADRPPVVTKQMGALRGYDATPRLRELGGIPTLVASAEFDPIAPPEYGRALAAAIPGSRYVEFRGAAHGVVVEWPDRVNALLLEHFSEAERKAFTGTVEEAGGVVGT